MKRKTVGTWSARHTNLPRDSQESVKTPGQTGRDGWEWSRGGWMGMEQGGDGAGRALGL